MHERMHRLKCYIRDFRAIISFDWSTGSDEQHPHNITVVVVIKVIINAIMDPCGKICISSAIGSI